MRFIKVILIAILILWFAPVNQSQTTVASYGVTVTSLTTTGTGAVTGTTFAVPTTYAAMITWQVTANGSALSAILEGSNDNSSWATVDTQTTAAGGIKNFGFTSLKFIRCTQVSRTGGTSTSCTIVVNRGFITSSGASLSRILVDSGSSGVPSYSFSADSDTGLFHAGSDGIFVISNNSNSRYMFAPSIFRLSSALSLGWSSNTNPTLANEDIKIFRAAASDLRISDGTTEWLRVSGNSLTINGPLGWGSSGVTGVDARITRISPGIVKVGDDDSTDGKIEFGATLFAALGTPTNGTITYCSNCTIANPCASGGTGAIAKRLNGVWVCN